MRAPVRLPKHCTETAKPTSPKRRIICITGILSIGHGPVSALGSPSTVSRRGREVEAPGADLTADLGGIKRSTLPIRLGHTCKPLCIGSYTRDFVIEYGEVKRVQRTKFPVYHGLCIVLPLRSVFECPYAL
jgi:hypothetical protein